MSTVSRRDFLRLAGTMAGAVAGAGALGACATGSTSSGGSSAGASTAKSVLQSSLSDPDPKKALQTLVADYPSGATLNTVAIEQFRAQLPTYLSSSNPPDVLTWYAGSVARDYASKGLLLDLSDLWTGSGACANFSDALKQLSTGRERKADLRADQLLLVGRLLPEVRVRQVGREDPHDLGPVPRRVRRPQDARTFTRSQLAPGPPRG